MIEYIILLGLAMAPISEVRGAIIYGLGIGLNPYAVLLISILGNILAVPILFWFLKQAHFMNLAHKLFGKKAHETIDRWHKKFETWEEIALFAFVAVPLPLTGAWMGVFLSEILEMNRKKAFLAIALGIAAAGILVFLGSEGFFWTLGKIW